MYSGYFEQDGEKEEVHVAVKTVKGKKQYQLWAGSVVEIRF